MTPMTERCPSGSDVGTSTTGLFVYGVVDADGDRPRRPARARRRARRSSSSTGGVAAVVSAIALERPPGRRRDLLALQRGRSTRWRERGPAVPGPVRLGARRRARASSRTCWRPTRTTSSSCSTSSRAVRSSTCGRTYVEDAGAGRGRRGESRDRRAARAAPATCPRTRRYADRVRLGELVARGRGATACGRRRPARSDASLPLVVDARRPRPGSGLERVLDVALLVEHEPARGARGRAWRTLAEEVHERIRLRLIGPIAPYDFVGGDADGPDHRAPRAAAGAAAGDGRGGRAGPAAGRGGVLRPGARSGPSSRRSSGCARTGELTDDEATAWEDELVERLMVGQTDRAREE